MKILQVDDVTISASSNAFSCLVVHDFGICFETFLELVIILTLIALFGVALAFAVWAWCRRVIRKNERDVHQE